MFAGTTQVDTQKRFFVLGSGYHKPQPQPQPQTWQLSCRIAAALRHRQRCTNT